MKHPDTYCVPRGPVASFADAGSRHRPRFPGGCAIALRNHMIEHRSIRNTSSSANPGPVRNNGHWDSFRSTTWVLPGIAHVSGARCDTVHGPAPRGCAAVARAPRRPDERRLGDSGCVRWYRILQRCIRALGLETRVRHTTCMRACMLHSAKFGIARELL